MSLGFNPLIAELNKLDASPLYNWLGFIFTISSSTTPSTTHNGSLLPLIEELPLIRIFALEPNVAEGVSTLTPAT
ncbi:hypothetical protein D3C78_1134560 [compost metagenome]